MTNSLTAIVSLAFQTRYHHKEIASLLLETLPSVDRPTLGDHSIIPGWSCMSHITSTTDSAEETCLLLTLRPGNTHRDHTEHQPKGRIFNISILRQHSRHLFTLHPPAFSSKSHRGKSTDLDFCFFLDG